MDLRPPLQLQSMIKSMTDVVLPAIDPANDMAQEQAQLILGMMHLMASRLPLQYHYDRDELRRHLALARSVAEDARGGPQTSARLETLGATISAGAVALDGAQTAPADLEAATLAIRDELSRLLESLWRDGERDCRESAGKAVLAASREQIVRERAWFAPQGWDADTSAYPAIESLIDYPTAAD